jgi:hypothetical protein
LESRVDGRVLIEIIIKRGASILLWFAIKININVVADAVTIEGWVL